MLIWTTSFFMEYTFHCHLGLLLFMSSTFSLPYCKYYTTDTIITNSLSNGQADKWGLGAVQTLRIGWGLIQILLNIGRVSRVQLHTLSHHHHYKTICAIGLVSGKLRSQQRYHFRVGDTWHKLCHARGKNKMVSHVCQVTNISHQPRELVWSHTITCIHFLTPQMREIIFHRIIRDRSLRHTRDRIVTLYKEIIRSCTNVDHQPWEWVAQSQTSTLLHAHRISSWHTNHQRLQ